MSIETEIQSEVDTLKARFQETKSLYREVCALLFFRYGITPTTNKLYQFVRKGSMSAPADALTKFWDELRSKALLGLPGRPAMDQFRFVEPVDCLGQGVVVAVSLAASLPSDCRSSMTRSTRHWVRRRSSTC